MGLHAVKKVQTEPVVEQSKLDEMNDAWRQLMDGYAGTLDRELMDAILQLRLGTMELAHALNKAGQLQDPRYYMVPAVAQNYLPGILNKYLAFPARHRNNILASGENPHQMTLTQINMLHKKIEGIGIEFSSLNMLELRANHQFLRQKLNKGNDKAG